MSGWPWVHAAVDSESQREAREMFEETEEQTDPCDQCGLLPCRCPDENPWDRDPTYGLSWRGGGR